MEPRTREAFNRYLDRQAELNNTSADIVRGGKKFTVEPSVAQTLNDKQQESSAFLQRVNVTQVTEMKGDKLGLGVAGPIASRTNTAAGTKRTTVDPSTLDEDGYECKQTNSDTHIRYAKIDAWAKFKDFQTRIRNHIVKRQALDRIMVGWNGVSAAATTNKIANPLLQDVNIGWLQHIRAWNSGARHLAEGSVEDGKIVIDPTDGDYKNLDALVVDAVHNLLPSWARQDPELVAVLGDDLMHDKFFPLVNSNLEPTEELASDLIISAKRVGKKTAVTVPFFPPDAILIVRLTQKESNLSIYEQEGKRRRTIVDRAELDQIETYESSNDAYVVEDYDYALLIENIQLGATPPEPEDP
ncbi:phage major capsid protein, P2 family [Phenylobacterium sp.]|uniref:phage major capsid protein, P2 family n=1 Tax=Phenylobacterium sp. TaxID=1871053 RepID=UPI00301D4436